MLQFDYSGLHTFYDVGNSLNVPLLNDPDNKLLGRNRF